MASNALARHGAAWRVATLAAAALAAASHATDRGFVITDPDDDLEIRVFSLLQFRYQAAIRPDAADDDDLETGFDFRRARLGLKGNAVEERVSFEFEVEADDGDTLEVLDAWIGVSPTENVRIRAGQFKIRFDRERTVKPHLAIGATYSVLSKQINPIDQERVQGVDAEIRTDWWSVSAQVHDGSDSFNSGFGEDNALIAGNIRAEWAVLSGPGYLKKYKGGERVSTLKQFKDFTAPPGTPLGILLGVGGYAERREDDGATDGATRYVATADVSLEYDGFNAAVIGLARAAEDLNTGEKPQPEQVYGLVTQAGYYVTPTIEPFVRHEYAWTSDSKAEDFGLLTAGFNYYVIGNGLRFTLEGAYAYDGVPKFLEGKKDALLSTYDGEESFAIRAQLQLVF